MNMDRPEVAVVRCDHDIYNAEFEGEHDFNGALCHVGKVIEGEDLPRHHYPKEDVLQPKFQRVNHCESKTNDLKKL